MGLGSRAGDGNPPRSVSGASPLIHYGSELTEVTFRNPA